MHEICINDEFDPTKLFAMIKDEKVAKEAGWNLSATRKALVKTYLEGQAGASTDIYNTSTWESVQQQVMTLQDKSEQDFRAFRVVHVLVEEADDKKVTHMILADDDVSTADKSKREFIFKSDRRYGSMLQAVHMLLFGVGDGLLKSVKGAAYELYPTDDVGNRLTCGILDGVTIANGLVLEGQTGADDAKVSLIKKGPVTRIAAGAKIVQNSFLPNTDKGISALKLMYGIENNIAGIYQTTGEAELASRQARTATEVEQQAIEEARHENNQAAWLYVQWEAWLKETFRRLMVKNYPDANVDGYEEWKEFRRRCKNDDVPDKLMDIENWKVRAIRAIGLGSPVIAQRQTSWLLGIAGTLDERGRTNAIRDAIQVRFGPDKVDRYLPVQSRDDRKTTEHSIATLENNDFREGSAVPAGEDQPHRIHLTTHMGAMGTYVQAFQTAPDRMNIEEAVIFFQQAIPHSEQHIEFLLQDPMRKGEGEQFNAMLQQFVAVFREMVAAYQEIINRRNQQQAENQKLVEEAAEQKKSQAFELEMEKIHANERVERIKAQGLNETRFAKLEASVIAKQQQTIASIRQETTESVSRIMRENRESDADIARKTREQASESAGEAAESS